MARTKSTPAPVATKAQALAAEKARIAKDLEEVGRDERPPCLSGCGGFPKGKHARFVPGHDARYHSAIKKAAITAAGEEALKAEAAS